MPKSACIPIIFDFFPLPGLNTGPLSLNKPVQKTPLSTDQILATLPPPYSNSKLSVQVVEINGAHLESQATPDVLLTEFPYTKLEENEQILLSRQLGQSVTLAVRVTNNGLATTPPQSIPITMGFDPNPQVIHSQIPWSINATMRLTPQQVLVVYDFLSPDELLIGFNVLGVELLRLDNNSWVPAQKVAQGDINNEFAMLNFTSDSQMPSGNLTLWTENSPQPLLVRPLTFVQITLHETSQPAEQTQSTLTNENTTPDISTPSAIRTLAATPIVTDGQGLSPALIAVLSLLFAALAAAATVSYRCWQYRTEKTKQKIQNTPKLNGVFDNGLVTTSPARSSHLSDTFPSPGSRVSEYTIPVGEQTEMVTRDQLRHSGVPSTGTHATMWSTPQAQALPPPPPFPPQPTSPQVSG